MEISFLADISVTTKSKINSDLPEVLYVSLLFPFIWWGENEGLKIVEMSSNFYQGTATTQTTLQASQSLFDFVVTEISARNEMSFQSLFKV